MFSFKVKVCTIIYEAVRQSKIGNCDTELEQKILFSKEMKLGEGKTTYLLSASFRRRQPAGTSGK